MNLLWGQGIALANWVKAYLRLLQINTLDLVAFLFLLLPVLRAEVILSAHPHTNKIKIQILIKSFVSNTWYGPAVEIAQKEWGNGLLKPDLLDTVARIHHFVSLCVRLLLRCGFKTQVCVRNIWKTMGYVPSLVNQNHTELFASLSTVHWYHYSQW